MAPSLHLVVQVLSPHRLLCKYPNCHRVRETQKAVHSQYTVANVSRRRMNEQFLGTLLGRKKDTQMRAVKIEAVALTAEPHYITALFMTGSYLEAGAWVENGKS